MQTLQCDKPRLVAYMNVLIKGGSAKVRSETEQQRLAVSPIVATEQVGGNTTVDDTDPQFHAPARSLIPEHRQEGAKAIPAQPTVIHPLQDEQMAPQLTSAPMEPGRRVPAASSPQEDSGKSVHLWNLTHAELVELLIKSSDRVYEGPNNSLRLVSGLDGSERASMSREKPCPQPPARNSTAQGNMGVGKLTAPAQEFVQRMTRENDQRPSSADQPRPSSTISSMDTLLDPNAANGSLFLFASEQQDSPAHLSDKAVHQWMKHTTAEGEGKVVDGGLPSWWAFTQYPPWEGLERRFSGWGGSKSELVLEPLEVQVNMMLGDVGDGEKPKKWGDLMDMLNEPDESEEALEARRKELEEMARRRKAWDEKEARKKEEQEERAKEWERAREKKEKEQKEAWEMLRKEREEKEKDEKKEKDKAKKVQNEGKGVEKGKGKEKAVDNEKENESDGGVDVGKGKADDEAVDAETGEVVGKAKGKGKTKKKNKTKGKGKK
jgi:hypothetical protein